VPAHTKPISACSTQKAQCLHMLSVRCSPGRWNFQRVGVQLFVAQLGLPFAWCTPRISHFELSGLSGVPTLIQSLCERARTKSLSGACARGVREGLCASGHEQSLYRAPALVVTERGFVRAGSHATRIIAYWPKHALRLRCRACVCGHEPTAPRCLDVFKHMRRKCRTCRANFSFCENCSKSC